MVQLYTYVYNRGSAVALRCIVLLVAYGTLLAAVL